MARLYKPQRKHSIKQCTKLWPDCTSHSANISTNNAPNDGQIVQATTQSFQQTACQMMARLYKPKHKMMGQVAQLPVLLSVHLLLEEK